MIQTLSIKYAFSLNWRIDPLAEMRKRAEHLSIVLALYELADETLAMHALDQARELSSISWAPERALTRLDKLLAAIAL